MTTVHLMLQSITTSESSFLQKKNLSYVSLSPPSILFSMGAFLSSPAHIIEPPDALPVVVVVVVIKIQPLHRSVDFVSRRRAPLSGEPFRGASPHRDSHQGRSARGKISQCCTIRSSLKMLRYFPSRPPSPHIVPSFHGLSVSRRPTSPWPRTAGPLASVSLSHRLDITARMSFTRPGSPTS